MRFLDGFMGAAYDAVLPSMVVPLFRRYAGPGCKDLKMAILLRTDIYTVWCDNAAEEKRNNPAMMTPEDVRSIAKRFPGAKKHITSDRVRKWLHDQGCQDILVAVDATPGGRTWLERQVEAFKEGLF